MCIYKFLKMKIKKETKQKIKTKVPYSKKEIKRRNALYE